MTNGKVMDWIFVAHDRNRRWKSQAQSEFQMAWGKV